MEHPAAAMLSDDLCVSPPADSQALLHSQLLAGFSNVPEPLVLYFHSPAQNGKVQRN